MTDYETELIIKDIINNALEGNTFTYRTIKCWSEFKYFNRCIGSTKVIIKVLTLAANNLYKKYCKDVIAGVSDFNELLAYQQLLAVIDFYFNELKTVKAMVADYDKYLGNLRNFVQALSGKRRDD